MAKDQERVLRMNELRRELRNLSRNSDSIRDPKLRKEREKIEKQIQEAVDRESRKADRDSAKVSRKGFKEGGEVKEDFTRDGDTYRWDPVMGRYLKLGEDGSFIIDFHDPDPDDEQPKRRRVKKRGGGSVDRMMYATGGEVDSMMYADGRDTNRMAYGGGGGVYNNKKKYSTGGLVKREGAVEYQDGGNRVIRGGVKQQ